MSEFGVGIRNSVSSVKLQYMDIRRLRCGDERELDKVGPCFDHPIRADAATRFLESENHHILVAYGDQTVAGFVTGVETTQPDKGSEMFLYELGVDEKFRRKGIGTACGSFLMKTTLLHSLHMVQPERSVNQRPSCCRGNFRIEILPRPRAPQ